MLYPDELRAVVKLSKTTARAYFANAMLSVQGVRLRFSSQTKPARYVFLSFTSLSVNIAKL
jgi:hypothetical protein